MVNKIEITTFLFALKMLCLLLFVSFFTQLFVCYSSTLSSFTITWHDISYGTPPWIPNIHSKIERTLLLLFLFSILTHNCETTPGQVDWSELKSWADFAEELTVCAWHWPCLQHFVCAKCEKPFLGHRHYERKGLAYCETHYNQVIYLFIICDKEGKVSWLRTVLGRFAATCRKDWTCVCLGLNTGLAPL